MSIGIPIDADPALFRERPDIELHVWRTVRKLGDVRVWGYGASEIDAQGWATTSFLQVDCRGHNRQRAARLADQCRRMIKALPWIAWDEGVVAVVDCLDGPRWLPDENGAPQYITRYAIAHHPRQRHSPLSQEGVPWR